jgi:ribosome-associated protein
VLSLSQLAPWLSVHFDRASGPGGQNVNKVNTRATVLFDLLHCTALSPTEKQRIESQLASRLSRDGHVRVVSQRARTQAANRRLAETRLLELLQAALATRKRRVKTHPTSASLAQRLRAKRHRADVKSRRGPVIPD